MTEIAIGIQGRAGRITLTRPKALNALSHAMCRQVAVALDLWQQDPRVDVVVIAAEGSRAFCAGGDVAEVWRASMAGNPTLGRDFWRDEYRMNAQLALYPKPVISFMQGFTMGGGVGLGCHIGHRVVGESLQMAMPEAGIGLIPDVGGTLLLSRAPGRIGTYLGLTGARMGPADALHAGFADHFVPEGDWPDLIAAICARGDTAPIPKAARLPGDSPLQRAGGAIDRAFGGPDVAAIADSLRGSGQDWAAAALAALRRNAPLSMACTLALLRGLPEGADIRAALRREYRFTWRASERGLTDFLEGVRAQVIDKDRHPHWRNAGPADVDPAEVAALIAPLGEDELSF